MSKVELIEKTIRNMQALPEQDLAAVHDFAAFLLSRIEKNILTEEITQANLSSTSYQFLEEDKDLYTVNDLKEKYGK
jgi:hypothetical protein